jgi:hypothetical protein
MDVRDRASLAFQRCAHCVHQVILKKKQIPPPSLVQETKEHAKDELESCLARVSRSASPHRTH